MHKETDRTFLQAIADRIAAKVDAEIMSSISDHQAVPANMQATFSHTWSGGGTVEISPGDKTSVSIGYSVDFGGAMDSSSIIEWRVDVDPDPLGKLKLRRGAGLSKAAALRREQVAEQGSIGGHNGVQSLIDLSEGEHSLRISRVGTIIEYRCDGRTFMDYDPQNKLKLRRS